MSSYKSLIAVTDMMKLRGMNINGCPSDFDISGIIDNNPNSKKYIFANLVNYSNRFLGKKVIILYLDVSILLEITSLSTLFTYNYLSGY